MFNLMIVDDENKIVEELKCGIDWTTLDIVNVYTASSINSAKDIFGKLNISILLCNIEMPQGSGLELLAWVKEHYSETETILLSWHTDFDSAVQAIRMGSFDYLLKPVACLELETVLRKVINKINHNTKTAQNIQIGQQWSKYQLMLLESFWLDILDRNIILTATAIKKSADERNIRITEHMTFHIIYIKVRRWHSALTLREEKQLEFAVKTSIEENILKESKHGAVIQYGKGGYFVILSLNAFLDFDLMELKNNCKSFVDVCRLQFICDVNCYLGEESFAQDLPEQADKLMHLEMNNFAFENGVFNLNEFIYSSKEYLTPDFAVWVSMLAKGEADGVYGLVCRYIDDSLCSKGCDSIVLKKFQIDFTQIIFSLLKQKSILAHKLLSDTYSIETFFSVSHSITDLKAWTKHIIDKVRLLTCMGNVAESVSERAKKYIKQNIDHDINRSKIAKHLHLNPDYLARIFKKETGISIPDYIMHERLKTAKKMIMQTDMSISAIASSVGYSNFSYFSKLFKEQFGINPSAYKQQK